MTQHQRQQIVTARLLQQRAERMERQERNDEFASMVDSLGPSVMLAAMAGEMITQYPAEWDDE